MRSVRRNWSLTPIPPKIDDAANLHVAIKNDLNVFIENAAARGLSEYQTMKTVAAILMKSRQRGLIK